MSNYNFKNVEPHLLRRRRPVAAARRDGDAGVVAELAAAE